MAFIYSKDKEITGEVIREFINKHQRLIGDYKENMRYYKGEHKILKRKPRENYKPDNKMIVNYAKVIVDTFNGYFNGNPVKTSHDKDYVDREINQFKRRSSLENKESELAKLTSIYGHAFERMYQNEDSKTKVMNKTPLDTFVVYADRGDEDEGPLFAVIYQYTKDNELEGELIDSTHQYVLTGDRASVNISESSRHYYNAVPVIEYLENEERQSIFENVKTLIDGLNKAISAKADDVEYFADAYLKIVGAMLDDDSLGDFRQKRLINLVGDGAENVDISFLEKPNADETQENLIERLIDLIFEVSMVANINDETFGSSLSGVALEFKLQPMKNLALMKERKFKLSMQRRFEMFFQLPTNIPQTERDEWLNINYQFTRNIPRNLSDEAQVVSQLEGIVSKETQLSRLSFIDDPKEEMKRMEQENPTYSEDDFENQRNDFA